LLFFAALVAGWLYYYSHRQSRVVTETPIRSLAVGGSSASEEAGTRPKSEEAYNLFLHSLALPHDPGPNKDAIAVLEHVVGTDPNYAPAWEALGLRYYYDSTFSDGGEKMFQRSNSAYERALALDPNRELAASNLIINRVERGDLGRAY
jgi:Tfp pilus assembly protein PilF